MRQTICIAFLRCGHARVAVLDYWACARVVVPRCRAPGVNEARHSHADIGLLDGAAFASVPRAATVAAETVDDPRVAAGLAALREDEMQSTSARGYWRHLQPGLRGEQRRALQQKWFETADSLLGASRFLKSAEEAAQHVGEQPEVIAEV